MVALRADGPRERARRVLARRERVEHRAEVVPGRPAQVGPGAGVDVDAADGREHPPAAAGVLRLVVGEQAADDRGRVVPERGQVGLRERRRRADDVLAEPDPRRALHRQQVRVNHVGHVDPAVQVLVGLHVRVRVGGANLVVIVPLGEEPRRPQDDDGQAVLGLDELAQVLGGGFGDAVDVAWPRGHVLGDPGGRLPPQRGQRAAERAGRAGEDEAAQARRDGLLEQRQRAADGRVHECLLAVRADVRLVQRRGVQHGVDARQAVADDGPVRD